MRRNPTHSGRRICVLECYSADTRYGMLFAARDVSPAACNCDSRILAPKRVLSEHPAENYSPLASECRNGADVSVEVGQQFD